LLFACRLPREASSPRIALSRKSERLGVARVLDRLVACHVDRAAYTWLIRRFVDTEPPSSSSPTRPRFRLLRRRSTCMASSSHHDGDCSLEAFLRRYGLDDPVLREIARIVHEVDLADERYDALEAAGLDVLLRGLSLATEDERMLGPTARLFDGLYEFKKRRLLLRREAS